MALAKRDAEVEFLEAELAKVGHTHTSCLQPLSCSQTASVHLLLPGDLSAHCCIF